jgi:hypothetical protein
MGCTTLAHNTAGTAAVARVSGHPGSVQHTSVQHALVQGLGYGWPTVTSPCNDPAFKDSSSNEMAFMAITGNKRQPRRLGQRST